MRAMIRTLAVTNYRSLLALTVPLGPLNIITGHNGSGKSNLYRALRLLAATAQGGVVSALAREGGLQSTFWAGPETLTRRMRQGAAPIEGGPRQHNVRLRLGFASDDFGYGISIGLPQPSQTAFALDPEIKRETIWAGPFFRPASALVDRDGPMIRMRTGRSWKVIAKHVSAVGSLFTQVGTAETAPEVLQLRESIRGWRFYDQFRTDPGSPVRQPQIATRTPVLHHDGRDLAAALQTIREIGNAHALDVAIADAFPGSSLSIAGTPGGTLGIELHQDGLLRPLTGGELSDGTLRYLLWIAALLTPRPPALMVLNEPETSLHPDLLPALARLIIDASRHTQIWVVSHASRLVAALEQDDRCHSIYLEKVLGQTQITDQGLLDAPPWHWPD